MTVFDRYVLLQVPQWILVAIILYGLCLWLDLSGWAAAVVVAGFVVKDFVLFPFVRKAFESDERTVVERMVGETGIVKQDLGPQGYVEVRGELWRAETADGREVPVGSCIRVESCNGMTLTVSRETDHR